MALNHPDPALQECSSLSGFVVAVQANFYRVRLEGDRPLTPARVGCSPETATPLELLCTRRARLKKIGQQVMVGDRVLIEEPDWTGCRGAIAQVLPRQTVLDRPPVANANQLLLVFALAEPPLDPQQLSRFLVKGESIGLPLSLCLSKADLVSRAKQEAWCDRLQQWGYRPLCISLDNGQGLPMLADHLRGQTTVLSGPSGVGKSSLINYFIPSADLRVGDVSSKLNRGRHTTRHVELLELPMGGWLADTPGFNQPTLDSSPTQLAQHFPEIRQRLIAAPCQFADCLHRDEPGCGVREDWERYEHYLTLLEEAIAQQTAQERLGEAESTLKVKSKQEGQVQYEPKLASKKYRRPSRRGQRQALQDLCQDLEGLLTDPE